MMIVVSFQERGEGLDGLSRPGGSGKEMKIRDVISALEHIYAS